MSGCTPTMNENRRRWPSWGSRDSTGTASALPGLLLATRCLQSVIFTGVPMSVCTPTMNENRRRWPSWGSALPGLLLATRCLQSVIFTGVAHERLHTNSA